jgi:hypothetical protein
VTRRTRSFLIDNNTGRLFTNTAGKPNALSAVDAIVGENTVQSFEDLLNVDLSVVPEVMQMAVDNTAAGHGEDWEWSWKSGSIPYARSTITNAVQASVPLYNSGAYTLYNFAANELYGDQTQTHQLYLKWLEGSGTDNLVDWVTYTEEVANITFDGVRNNQPTSVQRLIINVPTTYTIPTSFNAVNITYNVSASGSGAYTFMGTAHGTNPTLGPVYKGSTYTFVLDASISGHPFYLTTDDGTNYVAGSYVDEYTSGVTGSRNTSGSVVFVVPEDAPDTLYYQCGNHSAMRGTINIKTPAVEVNEAGNPIVYFQHTQEGHNTPVELRPKPALTSQMTMVYDAANNQFVPQDLGDYLQKTPVFREKIEDEIQDEIAVSLANDTITNLAKVKNQTVFITNLSQQGELSVTTGTARWYAPFNLSITEVKAKLSTSADGPITLRVKKNNIINQTFTIATGSTSGDGAALVLSEGDYITVDITTVGAAAKGENLVLQFKYKQA